MPSCLATTPPLPTTTEPSKYSYLSMETDCLLLCWTGLIIPFQVYLPAALTLLSPSHLIHIKLYIYQVTVFCEAGQGCNTLAAVCWHIQVLSHRYGEVIRHYADWVLTLPCSKLIIDPLWLRQFWHRASHYDTNLWQHLLSLNSGLFYSRGASLCRSYDLFVLFKFIVDQYQNVC